jgi:hypothetical protein
MTTETYRTPPSAYPPGTVLANDHVIPSVEEYLVARLEAVIIERETPTELTRAGVPRKKLARQWHVDAAAVNAYAEALATVQAGAGWFNGDEPQRLIDDTYQRLVVEGRISPAQ